MPVAPLPCTAPGRSNGRHEQCSHHPRLDPRATLPPRGVPRRRRHRPPARRSADSHGRRTRARPRARHRRHRTPHRSTRSCASPAHGAPVVLSPEALDRGPPHPRGHPRPRRRHRAPLRRLHRLRRPRHPAHPRRPAPPAAALPRPLARRRLRPGGRARGRARPHAPAHLDPRHRPHRHPPRDPHGVRRDARRRHHAGRPRVRLARLLRRPRPPLALRARAHGRGGGHATRTASGCRPPTRWPPPASVPSSSRRRRAWPSSTAPTACSGCCASRSTTCASCSSSPTWPRR